MSYSSPQVLLAAGSSVLPLPAPTPAANLSPLVITPPAGVAMPSGGVLFFSQLTPNDGNLHLFTASFVVHVTAAETGGSVTLQYIVGGIPLSVTMDAGSHASNGSFASSVIAVADPNTSIIMQATGVTVGTARGYPLLVVN